MHRITLDQLANEYGYDDIIDAIEGERWAYDSVVPALCALGCEVEPDGTCEHDNPSVLRALGII